MVKIKTKLSRHSGHHKPRGLSDHAFGKVYWPYLPIVIAIAVLLGLTGRSGSLTSTLHNPTGQVLSYSTSMDVNQLLVDTNIARQANGVSSLQPNPELDRAAQVKAADMASQDYWSHDTPQGNPPWVFVTAQGYNYQKLGENLAAGLTNEQSTVNAWMASPPHRENMLDPAYSQVGFGSANIADYKAIGGGPVTIVVAFYGEPEGQTYELTGSSKIIVDAPNSLNTPNGTTLAATTTRSQLALAGTPLETKAGEIVGFGVVLALAFWAGKHVRSLRRAWRTGEAFVIKHPMVDLGFVIILGLLFILSRGVGFIQ